ncbi:MFS domain-containing protein [Meloidogyne graminicola]|uniref:MFS domain-containing protein n=1 Tax=Meloidogyne graminicola TaxID=189291 RepID=A0A8T0A0X6_9BILA|nr:MFS domain-containing protein [Meloidogyne graminicola]
MSSYFPYSHSKNMSTARDAEDDITSISETTMTAESENEGTAVSLTLKDDKTQVEKENEDSTLVSDTHTEQSLRAGLKGVYTSSLMLCLFSCGFGSSFQVGFHLGVLNTPAKILIEWQKESLTASILLVGGILANALLSSITHRFGHKGTLMYNNALVVIAMILQHLAKIFDNYIYMIISRFIIGINSGINMGLTSIYLCEIAPINLRGAIGCLSNCFLYLGFLFALVVGLPFMLGDEENWHLIFLLAFIPVSVQLTLLGFFGPESPKYSYIVCGDVIEAEKSLQLLRQRNDVREEMDMLDKELSKARSVSHQKIGICKMFSKKYLRWSLYLGIYLMFSVQISGSAPVGVYSTKIFEDANLSQLNAQFATCGIGVINVLSILFCVYLVQHPNIGRRTLFLTCLIGCCISTCLIGISIIMAEKAHNTTEEITSTKSFINEEIITTINTTPSSGGSIAAYFSIVFIGIYVIFFSIGFGSITESYLSDFFPSEARATGCSAATLSSLLFRLIVLFSFPILKKLIGPSVFFIYSACLLICSLLGFVILPETKNKEPERILRDIKRRRMQITSRCCCKL